MNVNRCDEKLTTTWLMSCAKMVFNYHSPLISYDKVMYISQWKEKTNIFYWQITYHKIFTLFNTKDKDGQQLGKTNFNLTDKI